jgi:flagellar M-ring protein FliF
MAEDQETGEAQGVASQLRRLWTALPVRRRVVVAVAAALALGAVGLVAVRPGQPGYALLYSGLAAEDVAAIAAELHRQNIPYRLGPGGSAIEVPVSAVAQVRLALAGAGLPRGGGVGFELFDEQRFGTTSFVEQVNYRRALQGELTRSIASIDAVESARVHLAMGRRSLFSAEDEAPSASVAVRLRRGRELSRAQVRGIVHLVASSVERLAPERVVIIDERGNVLTGAAEGPLGSAGEGEVNLEGILARRIREMLERVVGAGHVAVVVTAEMDYRAVEQTEELYDHDRRALRSESRAAAAESRSYEVNKIVRQTRGPGAHLKRLHVAVLVDQEVRQVPGGAPVHTPRSAEELAQLAAIAREAAGLDEARGDRLEMRSVPFARAAGGSAAAPVAAPATAAGMSPALVAIGAGSLLALILIAALRLTWPGRRRAQLATGELVALPASIEEVERALSAPPVGAAAAGLPAAMRAALALPSDGEGVHQRIQDLARREPQRAARVLSSWLAQATRPEEKERMRDAS